MKKVLLVGEYFSANLGDPLLCRTVERILVSEIDEIEIIPLDMSGKTSMCTYYQINKYSTTQKVFRKISKKFNNICMKLPYYRVYYKSQLRVMRVWCMLNDILQKNKIDLVVFAGGEIFMDYFVAIIYLIAKRMKRTKIIFHACGMHNLSNDSVNLLKSVFKQRNVLSISLRDSYKRFCQLFSVEYKTIETYDTALLCSKYFDPNDVKNMEYGIGIIDNEETKEFQKNLLRYFIASNKNWRIILNGSSYDYEFAKKMLTELNITDEDKEKFLYDCPQNAEELVKGITNFKYIISFRMHSQVVAASFGIPSYGFVWDTKIVEFYDKLDLSGNYTYPNGTLNIKEIFECLNINESLIKENALKRGNHSKACLIKEVKNALAL